MKFDYTLMQGLPDICQFNSLFEADAVRINGLSYNNVMSIGHWDAIGSLACSTISSYPLARLGLRYRAFQCDCSRVDVVK